MTKRKFLMAILAVLPVAMFAQKTRQKKFYITGLGNDCTIPPIVAYGNDRVDALLHCCSGGGLTVWTEEEYEQMRRDIGKKFDEECKLRSRQTGGRDPE